MKRKKAKVRAKKVCASISFPSYFYDALGKVVEQKKVSFGWVVRDAAEK